MAISDELRSVLADPRQTTMLRERAERVFTKPITLFTEADVLAAWAPLMSRDLARELLDALAFAERMDAEELALVGELALVAEDCYRAWSADLDTDGAEWRQLAWSYTERRGHRSMLLHVSRWDGDVISLRTSPEGLGRLIQRLAEAQREWAAQGGAIDTDAVQQARDLLDEASDVDAGHGDDG